MRVGFVPMRAQTPKLHKGHEYLLTLVDNHNDSVVVLLGYRNTFASQKNPLDLEARVQMIKTTHPGVTVVPFPDTSTDEEWSARLDTLMELMNPNGVNTLYCGRDGFKEHYLGNTTVREISCQYDDSATALRDAIARPVDSEDFRAGMVYAQNIRRPMTIPAVDAAVVWVNTTDDSRYVVMPGRPYELARFPGGHVDPHENMETAVQREMREEMGIDLAGWTYLGSYDVSDWRQAGTEDGMLSSLFYTIYPAPDTSAIDEMITLTEGFQTWTWMLLDPRFADDIIPEHRQMFLDLCERFNTTED